VLLPERNMKDLVDVPKKVLSDMKIIPVTHMDQVLDVALHPPVERKSRMQAEKKTEKKSSAKKAAKETTPVES
jgi:ATP-dependent Lon protease